MASDEEQESNYEALAYQQRIKAALHYTVGRICEKTGEETGVQYSRQFIAALTETTYRQCVLLKKNAKLKLGALLLDSESFAVDLELFAKHAKRTTINRDDVQLLARKSPALAKHIKSLSDEIAASNEAEKANKKIRRIKTKSKDHEDNETNNTETV